MSDDLTNDELNTPPTGDEIPPTGDDLTPPTGNDTPPAGDEVVIDFKIPEEYSSNQTIASAKSVEDLCKTIANQEVLIGKKIVGIPDETSSPEEVAKFKEAFGVPTTFEDYTLDETPKIKEIYGDKNEEVMTEFKKVLFDAGVNSKQASALTKGYDSILGGLLEEQKTKQAAAVAEFEGIIDTAFGMEKEAKLQVAEEFLKENLSDGVKPYLPVVLSDPKALAVVADIVNNIYPDLKPDSLDGRGGSQVGKTLADLNADMQKVIGSEEFQNNRHPGHDAKKAEWLNIAKQIEALKNK